MSDTPIVKVENLTSGFNQTPVLHNVSMVARENEVTAILGASGCGKTTLLKHLFRLYYPWEGSIKLFGQEITTMDEKRFNWVLKKIGVLFQNGALINSISLAENIAIPLHQHTNLPEAIIDRLIRLKLQLVGLESDMHKLPSELSGGMRKRASLARAIALDPPLLFCDEPSAGLDPITAESLDRLILKLRQELNISIIVVTHEVASIMRIADSIVFMDNGKVLYNGALEDTQSANIDKIDDFFSKAELST